MSDLLYLHFDVRGDLLDAARQCEEEVFLQAFGNTRAQLEDEYGPYNDQSLFMAVSDSRGDVVGACRILSDGPAGLKTLNDIQRDPWRVDGMRSAGLAGIDPARTWDIATLGVRRDFRGPKFMVALSMYHGLLKAGRVNEMQTGIAILDLKAYEAMLGAGLTFAALPGTRPASYLGSESSVPMYGHFSEVADAQRRTQPDLYRLVTLGIGIDGVSVPDDAAFLRKPAEQPAPARPALVPVAAA